MAIVIFCEEYVGFSLVCFCDDGEGVNLQTVEDWKVWGSQRLELW